MREMICICCPLGCHLHVDEENLQDIKVTGNTCKRGENYAKDEVICPKRMVTSVVKVKGGNINMVSVKTDKPIKKELIFDCLQLLKDVELKSPVKIGDKVLQNVCGTDVNIIVTKNV